LLMALPEIRKLLDGVAQILHGFFFIQAVLQSQDDSLIERSTSVARRNLQRLVQQAKRIFKFLRRSVGVIKREDAGTIGIFLARLNPLRVLSNGLVDIAIPIRGVEDRSAGKSIGRLPPLLLAQQCNAIVVPA